MQRGHHFAIVDEVDSILIDEARTPLIISGPSEESTDKYYKVNRIIPKLVRGEVIEGKEPGEKYTTGDYTVDEKHRSVALTEEGVAKVRAAAEHRQPVRPREHRDATTTSQQALKAHVLFHRDTRLRGQGRRGHHRRRVHRPPDARPPLVRRAAPGRRGQGRRQDRAREPDARHHHLPELLPHVQEAGRHDRYGRDRSGRVPEDLQPGRHRHPHQPAADPQGEPGRRLPHRGREVPQRRQGDQGAATRRASPCWWAPSRSRSPSSSPAS